MKENNIYSTSNNEQESRKKAFYIIFLTCLIILIIFLICLFVVRLNEAKKKKVVYEDQSALIVEHMLDVVNVDIEDETKRATDITNFAFEGQVVKIVASSEAQVFFYSCSTSLYSDMNDLLYAFVNNYEPFMVPDEIAYFDKCDEATCDFETKLVTSSKDEVKYHISILAKENNYYYTVPHFVNEKNEFTYALSSFSHYPSDEGRIAQLYKHILGA